MTPRLLVSFIESRRFPLQSETRLQEKISEALSAEGIEHEREVRLSGSDIVDFLFPGGVAIEVKLKGQRMAIYRQCERYCQHPEVTSIILATNLAMGLPEVINGRPTLVANLGRGWL